MSDGCRLIQVASLSATLAFSGCSLAGCSDGLPPTKMPSLATATPSGPEHDELESEPDLDALTGRLDTIVASPGFSPDPLTVTATTVGGPIALHDYDERCDGYVTSAPDVILRAERPFAELVIMVSSEVDLSLMVAIPDGDVRCADDEESTMPVVRGDFDAGLYRIWVGTAEPGIEAPFTLALSEYEDSLPSALLAVPHPADPTAPP